MSTAPKLTKDRNNCYNCGIEQDLNYIENKLNKNKFSISISCSKCNVTTEYYYSSNGFINHRLAKRK